MSELLLEVGCEEIPAEDLSILPAELRKRAAEAFENNRLVYTNLETYATPRRLTLKAEIEDMQPDLREERMGPPRKIAVDSNGRPTPAGAGFARNLKIPFRRLKTVSTPKGEYLCGEILIKGKRTARVLQEIIPRLILDLPFHKFMRWESETLLFGRPIRNLLLLFGEKTIPIKIGSVRSGRYTFGHRFLGQKKIPVSSFEGYCHSLEENGVMLKFEDRVRKISAELEDHARSAGGVLRSDSPLLNIMANEVEFPEVLRGSFPPIFLSLPQEILINAMRKHQKYFCALDESGNLLPVFLTVLNTRARNTDLIRKGHERVLQARLRDAEFFWKEDRKTTLVSRTEGLQRLTYHERLGSYKDKISRMQQIAEQILLHTNRRDLEEDLRRLIKIAKTDLLTLMVGEFPELQGHMAGLYAREEGVDENQWQALYDQYLPVTSDDPLPRNTSGALLSLTDRIEALCAGFVLNMIPTGSRDPYGLRRIATGAMRIILQYELDLDLNVLFEYALSLYSVPTKIPMEQLKQGLLELMESRFRFLMEQQGMAHDYLNAVLVVESNPVTARKKLLALQPMEQSADLKTLARCFKRINNIISNQDNQEFNEELVVEDGEIRLYRAFDDLAFRVEQNILVGDYQDALEIMVTLGPEIDQFFDEVLVMTDQLELRNNRIALLQRISRLYRKLADFSELQIEL